MKYDSILYMLFLLIVLPIINSYKLFVSIDNLTINAPATLAANVGALIPANFPTYINMTGIGNRISVLPVSGVNTAITLTECGTVFQSALNQNSTTFKNT